MSTRRSPADGGVPLHLLWALLAFFIVAIIVVMALTLDLRIEPGALSSGGAQMPFGAAHPQSSGPRAGNTSIVSQGASGATVIAFRRSSTVS